MKEGPYAQDVHFYRAKLRERACEGNVQRGEMTTSFFCASLSRARLSLARVLKILSYYVNKTAPDYHRSCSTGSFATRKSSNARAVAVGD